MKYLVNRETKKHVRWQQDLSLCADWDVIDADPEGWIPHDGTECPLPGDAWCAYKMRDGSSSRYYGSAISLRWSYEYGDSNADIVAYRPTLETASEATEPQLSYHALQCEKQNEQGFADREPRT